VQVAVREWEEKFQNIENSNSFMLINDSMAFDVFAHSRVDVPLPQ
jgi:hypothetical protein